MGEQGDVPQLDKMLSLSVGALALHRYWDCAIQAFRLTWFNHDAASGRGSHWLPMLAS